MDKVYSGDYTLPEFAEFGAAEALECGLGEEAVKAAVEAAKASVERGDNFDLTETECACIAMHTAGEEKVSAGMKAGKARGLTYGALSGLRKLPCAEKVVLCRGVPEKMDAAACVQGAQVVWEEMVLATRDINLSRRFADESGTIFVMFGNFVAHDVATWTVEDKERHYLMEPGATFEIMHVLNGGIDIVFLKGVKHERPLMDKLPPAHKCPNILEPKLSVQDFQAVSVFAQLLNGAPEEQFLFGDSLWEGVNMPRNIPLALFWFEEAAMHGHPIAQFKLGAAFQRIEQIQNLETAIEWYTKSAEQEYTDAMVNLGALYMTSPEPFYKPELAVSWWTKAAERCHDGAEMNLSVCYQNGEGTKKNQEKARLFLQKAADHGNMHAIFTLGVNYDEGNGVKKNKAKAIEMYTMAAMQGYPPAQINLGSCYKDGNGVTKDMNWAITWWTKAAMQGHPTAQVNLAVAYKKGDGVPMDQKRSIGWWVKAAAQGHPGAQFEMGNHHEQGWGVKKDLKMAIDWWTKAAQNDYPDAQEKLGKCYQDGRGVKKNPERAQSWFQKAAENRKK